MKEIDNFRLESVSYDVGIGAPTTLQLVANPEITKNDYHITLLMGANGTSKSRILSSCVSFLRQAEEQIVPREERQTTRFHRPDSSENSLECKSVVAYRSGVRTTISRAGGTPENWLPSRVVAIANLVRDRFTFMDSEGEAEQFYYYLGVRQASNLTTTGAMDRLVTDSIFNIILQDKKFKKFVTWSEFLIPGFECALQFSDFSPTRFEAFLADPEKHLKKFKGSGRTSAYIETANDRRLTEIHQKRDALRELFEILNFNGESTAFSGRESRSNKHERVLVLNTLSSSLRQRIGALKKIISLASSARVLRRPSTLIKLQNWLDFSQLSSGEQNLLATGARLIGYASPASFIVIDEPEVSLNVAWQQRYIELVLSALSNARGSHVLIASHSPYLVSDLEQSNATVVVAEKKEGVVRFKSHASEFWGWGTEAILYDLLGIPSASNYQFSRDLTHVLKLIQGKSKDRAAFERFLAKCDLIEFPTDAEPLELVIAEVRGYYQSLVDQ